MSEQETIEPEYRIDIPDDPDGAASSPSGNAGTAASSGSSLRVEVWCPPSTDVDYLSALINTDPRVDFEELHKGLLELIRGSDTVTREPIPFTESVAEEEAFFEVGDELRRIALRYHWLDLDHRESGLPYLETDLHHYIADRKPFDISEGDNIILPSDADSLKEIMGPELSHLFGR